MKPDSDDSTSTTPSIYPNLQAVANGDECEAAATPELQKDLLLVGSFESIFLKIFLWIAGLAPIFKMTCWYRGSSGTYFSGIFPSSSAFVFE